MYWNKKNTWILPVVGLLIIVIAITGLIVTRVILSQQAQKEKQETQALKEQLAQQDQQVLQEITQQNQQAQQAQHTQGTEIQQQPNQSQPGATWNPSASSQQASSGAAAPAAAAPAAPSAADPTAALNSIVQQLNPNDPSVAAGQNDWIKGLAKMASTIQQFRSVLPAQAPTGTPVAPTSSRSLILVADDGKDTYLGKLTTNITDPDSIYNEACTYGSKASFVSIWDQAGLYGSPASPYSPFNAVTSMSPMIVNANNQVVGRLTVNQTVPGAVNPNQLYSILQSNAY